MPPANEGRAYHGLWPEKKERWKNVNEIIGKNNAGAIESSSGLVAVLDGTDAGSMTAAEIGYAAVLGKRPTCAEVNIRPTSLF